VTQTKHSVNAGYGAKWQAGGGREPPPEPAFFQRNSNYGMRDRRQHGATR
jgi:hypothetical protein